MTKKNPGGGPSGGGQWKRGPGRGATDFPVQMYSNVPQTPPEGAWTPRGRGRGRGCGSGRDEIPSFRGRGIGVTQESIPVNRIGPYSTLSEQLFAARPLLRPIEFVRSKDTPFLFMHDPEDDDGILKPLASDVKHYDPESPYISESSLSEDEVEVEEVDFSNMERLFDQNGNLKKRKVKRDDVRRIIEDQIAPGFTSTSTPATVTVVEEDEDIIVYVAPHPRKFSSRTTETHTLTLPAAGSFVPYERPTAIDAIRTHPDEPARIEPTNVESERNQGEMPVMCIPDVTLDINPAVTPEPTITSPAAAPLTMTPAAHNTPPETDAPVQTQEPISAPNSNPPSPNLTHPAIPTTSSLTFNFPPSAPDGYNHPLLSLRLSKKYGNRERLIHKRDLKKVPNHRSDNSPTDIVSGRDRRWMERRRGDSDLDWGDEGDDENTVSGLGCPKTPNLNQGMSEKALAKQKAVTSFSPGPGSSLFQSPAPDQLPAPSFSTPGNISHVISTSVSSSINHSVLDSKEVQKGRPEVETDSPQHREPNTNNNNDNGNGMKIDSGIDVDAMKRFVNGMLGRDAGTFTTMADIAVEEKIKAEDEDEGDESDDEDEDDGNENEDEEGLEQVLRLEKLNISESDEDDDDDDEDGDDDDEHFLTPRSSFQARLAKLRAMSRSRKTKVDMGNSDEAAENTLELNMAWAEEQDEDNDDDGSTHQIQEKLGKDSNILQNRTNRKGLFEAVRNGNFYADSEIGITPARKNKDKYKDLSAELSEQWEKDRKRKAERKRQRQLEKQLTASDPFVKKKGGEKGRKAMVQALSNPVSDGQTGHTTITLKKLTDLSLLARQIRLWIENLDGPEHMVLPPAPKAIRKEVHKLALAFSLKSHSKGNDKNRYTTLTKTSRSGVGRVDEKKVSKVLWRSAGGDDRDFRDDGLESHRGIGGGRGKTRGGGGGNGREAPRHKEGDEVGATAPKIGSGNIGFKMLAAMGWTEGERIGLSGGLDAPLKAIIKMSRLGLGASK